MGHFDPYSRSPSHTSMYNPSWVEGPQSSHPCYKTGGTKAEQPSVPFWIRIVIASLRIILKDESQTVGNSQPCWLVRR